MAFEGATTIWMDGKLVPWAEANIHVCSHVIHYGSAIFEGIRSYKTPHGTTVFRLDEHIRRLLASAKIYRMPPRHDLATLCRATLDTIRANKLEQCYIRPVVYRGYGALGVNPSACPVDTAIACWAWGAYLGPDAPTKGVDVMVSTWNRLAPNTMPSLAKCGANYMNSQLINLEARAHGFAEGIALTFDGFVSEGSGENIFVVWNGRLLTPPISQAILPGITRATVMTLAAEAGLTVEEAQIPRELLYVADEVFFTGTAAEVTPVRSVDGIAVGDGKPGAITRQLQTTYMEEVSGASPRHPEWHTPVYG